MTSISTRLRKSYSSFTSRQTTVGESLRSAIHHFTLTVHPYVAKVIPNFRAAHYTYILFLSFLLSVILYVILDFAYIDILFLACGSSTQAGLNTINLNELRLSQQILVYINTTIATPIFIHGLLLFIRLYWFERYFDNIKESSKLNFKMRRNATLAARTRSMDNTVVNTVNNQNLGLKTPTSPSKNPTVSAASVHLPTDSSSTMPSKGEKSVHETYPEPEDDGGPTSPIRDHEGIKFAELPRPTKRTTEIDPSDMYKSIAMLQNKRRNSNLDSDVLVIKPPNEIERSGNTSIFTTRAHLPRSPRRRHSVWRMGKRRRTRWNALKSSITSNGPLHRRKRTSSTEIDNESIDSEAGRMLDEGGSGDNTSANEDLDCSFNSNDADDDPSDDNENAIEDTDEDAPEAQTSPRYGGMVTKFEEPDINRPKRSSRSRRHLRRWRTPVVSRMASRNPTDDSYNQRPNDDEEADILETFQPLQKTMSTSYLSWTPTIGRNSTFVHLTDEQKEELGGVEYRAVKLLIKIIVAYYIGFHAMAFIMYVVFIKLSSSAHYAAEIRGYGISPVWWGFFTAQSTFNDLGLTLTPNSMYSFSRSIYIMLIACWFIVIGNTGFPMLLRFIIWVMFKTAKPLSLYKESLGFLLDHPRRCFTLLFPAMPTWWLFAILVILNALDLILFIVLDLNEPYLSYIPTKYKVVNGMFQAFTTRTAGFSVLDLSQLHSAVQVSYMIMMYISVLPLAISIRRTNVYEEQSLGVYLRAEETEAKDTNNAKSFIGTHLRNQLSFDLWFIFLGLFIICIAESSHLDDQTDSRFTVFSVLFEIISAYGTVGLSLGYPDVDESLSYKFTTVSKLVIIAMMIRGRHRGLPYSLDRAIMLPDSDMQRRDQMQELHAIKLNNTLDPMPSRTTSFSSGHGSGLGGKIGGLKRTITRTAGAYRRNSLFPQPTALPEEEHEMHNMRTARLRSQALV